MGPITILLGFNVSWIARPSRRNSGLEHRPKPSPHVLPEDCSSMGLTTLLVVPGMTVLFTMTVGCRVEPAMASPIYRDADSTCERSISPDMLLGVPTVM